MIPSPTKHVSGEGLRIDKYDSPERHNIRCDSRETAANLLRVATELVDWFNEKRTQSVQVSSYYFFDCRVDVILCRLQALEDSLGGEVAGFYKAAISAIAKYATVSDYSHVRGTTSLGIKLALTKEGLIAKRKYGKEWAVEFTAAAEKGVCQNFQINFVNIQNQK